jgi:hypothetical protein
VIATPREGAMVVSEFAKKREDRHFGLRSSIQGERSRGGSLASLGATGLGERFYSWRGRSGRRYVFSVFDASERALVADFSEATIVGVVREGATRRPVYALASRDFHLRTLGCEADAANEWHVLFERDEGVLRDLCASLLN